MGDFFMVYAEKLTKKPKQHTLKPVLNTGHIMRLLRRTILFSLCAIAIIPVAAPVSSFALPDETSAGFRGKSDQWREIADNVGKERQSISRRLPDMKLPEQAREATAPIRDTASGVLEPLKPGHTTDDIANQSPAKQSTPPEKPLTGKKLQACKKREKGIHSIMASVVKRSERQLTVFTQIANRTENFHERRGYTLENYKDLTSEVAMRRILAEDAIENIKHESNNFTCKSAHPKADIESLKNQIHLQQQLMQDYRTAIKNFVRAVKSVQPESDMKPAAQNGTSYE